MNIETQLQSALDRIYLDVENAAKELNLVMSIKLLAFAHKYRIIRFKPGLDLFNHNASKASIELAINYIIGVHEVHVVITDWKVQAHVSIEDAFWCNFVFNSEFHSDIQKILRALCPKEFTTHVILYSNIQK